VFDYQTNGFNWQVKDSWTRSGCCCFCGSGFGETNGASLA